MKTFIGILLYSLLGISLARAGVSVTEKPVDFLLILGIVVAIDVTTMVKYS